MLRGTKNLIAGAAVVLAATIPSAAAERGPSSGTAAERGLMSKLDVDRAQIGVGEDVSIRFTLENATARDILLPYWQTPVRGVWNDLFDVRRDGARVEYVGREYKWATPKAEDYVRIPAGGTLSAKVELSSVYDISRTGEYTIRYRIPAHELRFVEGAEGWAGAGAEKVASNAVSLAVERDETGIDEAIANMIEEANATNRYLTPSYVSCSSSRQSTLVSALSAAQTMAQKAKAYTNAGTVGTPWTTWFGTYNSTRYATVNTHYNNIYNVFTTKTVTFYCDCTDSAYAYVYKNQPYRIHLCNAFWSAPLTGTDSKGGTLVHETSHFTVVADTDDWAYGQTACRSLATSNPSRAIDNADSHEYFAEAR